MINVPYVKLKEICNVNQGLQIPISDRFSENGPNRYFYITVQFLKTGHLEKYYIENPPKSTICNENDIIIVRTGSTGQILTGIVGCFHNNFFKVNYDNKKVVGKYLFYCLNTNEKQREMKKRAGITTIPDLNHFMFLDMKIPLPSIKYQEYAAKILDAISNKIELNNKINAELEAMAKLIYDYWFVQFEFPFDFAQGKPKENVTLSGVERYKSSGGKMVFNEELKREIPEGWEVDTLSTWIDKDKSGDWGKEEIQGNYIERVFCIRGADLNGLNGNGEVKSPERFILEKNKHKILDKGDFIVEISGGSPKQSTGRMAYVTDATLNRFDAPIICSNFCKAVTLKDEKFMYNFAFEWNRAYDHGVLFGYEGKTSGIKNLLFDSFVTSYYTPIPPKELAEKFHDFMSPLEEKKQKNLKENQELASLRDWLLPMLMNGQVKIGGVSEELGMVAEAKMKYGEKL